VKFDVIFNEKHNKTVTPDETLKETALLYLQEALVKEQYEQAPKLIYTAKRYGAKTSDIRKAIAWYIRRLKNGPPNESGRKRRGRKRF